MVQSILFDRAGKPAQIERPQGSVLFETCNRTELYWGDGEIRDETSRHLYRVASGLESPLLGEMAILGQLRDSYMRAKSDTKLSAPLNRLFQTALHVGHRTRIETGIAKGAVSYSQITADVLSDRYKELADLRIAIIGVNDMTEAILNFLTKRGARNLLLSNRSFDKAEEMASRYGAAALPLAEKSTLLDEADVVVSATSAPHTIVHTSDFQSYSKEQLLIDLAYPADIDEEVSGLPGKEVLKLGQIESMARQNLERRAGEIPRCEQIIEEEIAELNHWQSFRKKIV